MRDIIAVLVGDSAGCAVNLELQRPAVGVHQEVKPAEWFGVIGELELDLALRPGILPHPDDVIARLMLRRPVIGKARLTGVRHSH